MRTVIVFVAAYVIAFAAASGDEATIERAKSEESFACVQCHSLRIVHSQRLSKTAWTKEVDKMIGWGAPVRDRQLLIDYLSEEFSDAKPMPEPDRSKDGTKRSSIISDPAKAPALKD
ncbi:MAG TPA: hypothetical protein VKB79_04265 [Bryobacteraceae bacterium]|nr:hypothetical protein [Bryobacteraceae bacterium]